MRTVRLGRTNAHVPAVSIGTWSHGGPNEVGGQAVGWSGHDDRLAKDALRRAFDAGLFHWDTADVYGDGHAEQLIGQVLAEIPRDSVFVASKVGWDSGGFGHFYHPDLVQDRIDRSLRNLQTDHIDLYYLHHCNFGESSEYLDGALEVIHRARDAGKIRFIGLSDWSSRKLLDYVRRVDPDVIQPYRNVGDDEYTMSGLKAWVAQHDAGVAFFSPLRHGLLLGKHDAPPELGQGDFRSTVAGFKDPDVLRMMRQRRARLEERFEGHPQPVLHGLVDSLLADSPTGCVLLGVRNADQAEAAATLGQPVSGEDAEWVKTLYQTRAG